MFNFTFLQVYESSKQNCLKHMLTTTLQICLRIARSSHRILAHLSRRLIGELIVYRSSRRLSVRACVRPFTLSSMNISATSWPIGMKYYLKHHWCGEKASVCFDPDRIRTLVSMATDSSHRVIMGKKRRHHVFSNAFDLILFILAGNDDMHESLDEVEIWRDLTTNYGVSCP